MTSIIMRAVVLLVGAIAGMTFFLDGNYYVAGLTLAAALAFAVTSILEGV